MLVTFMNFVSRRRFFLLLRLSCVALASVVLSGQAPPSEPQRLSFPFKNKSDFRGIYNVFSSFRRACLDQPVTRDLPASLVPDGFKIVTPGFHLFGEDNGGVKNVAILSKTGLEEDDFAGGHPIVRFTMPADNQSNGHCSIDWNRSWDYAVEHVPKIMDDTAARLDAHISFRLKAFLTSKPSPSFQRSKRYSLYSEWATPCWGENICSFSLMTQLDPKRGIYIILSLKEVL